MTADPPRPIDAWFDRVVISLLSAALLIQLGVMAWMGSYMRMSGDDYCYGALYRQNGLFSGVIQSYLTQGPYNGNRFSLTLFSNLAELFGPVANAVLPGLSAAIFVTGLFLFVRKALHVVPWTGTRTPNLTALTMALAIVFFTLLLTPEIRQSLYWRSAMLPYLAPLIAGAFMALAVLFYWKRQRISYPGAAGLFVLGLLAGGFSETGAVFLAASMVQGVLSAFLWAMLRHARPSRGFLTAASLSLAGLITAMALLAVSPANSSRIGDAASSISISQTALIAFRSTYGFIYSSLRSQPIPAAVFFLIFFLISFLHGPEKPASKLPRLRAIIPAAAVLASTAAVIWASMLPFALVQHSYPEPRALVMARFELNLAIAGFGWLLGIMARSFLSSWKNQIHIFRTLALVGLGLAAAYTLYLLPVTLQYQRIFEKWSQLWDQRNTAILASARANADSVEVMELDHIIPEVGELSPDPGYWYNGCAEMYYGVKEIRASLPGWDTAE